MTRSVALPIALALAVLLLWSGLAPAPAAAQSAELARQAQRGMDAMAAGRFDEAAAIYAEIVKALPDEPGMIMNLGMAQAMAGRPREAIPHLEKAVKLQPDLLPAQLFLGAAHLEVGDPARAVPPLERVVSLDPRQIDARRMLGDALLQLERFGEAIGQFGTLAELAPDEPGIWAGLGRSYEGLALATFEALEREASESPYVFLLTADALAAQRRDAGALRLYRAALEALPGPPPAGVHEAVAAIYERAGRPDWAAVERQKASRVPPPDCSIRTPVCEFLADRHAGILEMANGRDDPHSRYWLIRAANELALEAFERLAKLPPSIDAHQVRAHMHRNQGRHLESVEELRKALQLAPGHPRLKRDLALGLYLTRDHEAARPLLARLRESDPADAELAFLYGDVLLQAQEVEEAIPHLLDAATRAPDLLAARSSLGRAYVQAGRAAEAVPHLQAALPEDEDGSLHYQLALAYQAAGEPQRAREMLEKYRELQEAAASDPAAAAQITPP